MKPTVFIHTNDKQLLGAKVAEYSIRQTSTHNDAFDVQYINLKDYPWLHRREGRSYLREGREAVWRNDDLQSFTPLRFMPPQLMGYQGRALVIDPDVFALTDVYELLTVDMQGKALACRKVEATDGKPAYYATSVMLMDCAKLTHWNWEKQIADLFSMQLDYRPWMSLLLEPEESILLLDEYWNHYDTLNDQTKLLHNTGRVTQPWKTGLPIDFTPKVPLASAPRKWGVIPRPLIARVRALLAGKPYHQPGFYQKHPDPNQERFFFSLLRGALDAGLVTEAFLRDEIKRRHVRADAFDVLATINDKVAR